MYLIVQQSSKPTRQETFTLPMDDDNEAFAKIQQLRFHGQQNQSGCTSGTTSLQILPSAWLLQTYLAQTNVTPMPASHHFSLFLPTHVITDSADDHLVQLTSGFLLLFTGSIIINRNILAFLPPFLLVQPNHLVGPHTDHLCE